MEIWEEYAASRKKLIHDLKLAGIPLFLLFFASASFIFCSFYFESAIELILALCLAIISASLFSALLVGAILFGIPTVFKFAWQHIIGWSIPLAFVLLIVGYSFGWLFMVITLIKDVVRFREMKTLLTTTIEQSGLYDTTNEDADSIIFRQISPNQNCNQEKKTILIFAIVGSCLSIFVGAYLWYTMTHDMDSFKYSKEDRELYAQYEFDEEDDGYIISYKGAKPTGHVVLPDSFDGKPIIGIASSGFENCQNITSIVLPENLVFIDHSAFANCTQLTNIVIPNSVTHIDDNAFYGCTGLSQVQFSQNLAYIGLGAFSDCTSLTTVQLPNSLVEIKIGVMWDDGAFEGCNSLKSLHVGAGLEKLEYHMFSSCESLENIYIPSTLSEIQFHTFAYDLNIQHIYFDGTIEQWETVYIDEVAFEKECHITVHCSDGDVTLDISEDPAID